MGSLQSAQPSQLEQPQCGPGQRIVRAGDGQVGPAPNAARAEAELLSHAEKKFSPRGADCFRRCPDRFRLAASYAGGSESRFSAPAGAVSSGTRLEFLCAEACDQV